MSDEEVVGTAVIRVVVDRSGADQDIDRAVRDANKRTETASRTSGKRDGDAYGDAYSRAIRQRVEAAASKLPKQKLDLDTSPAEQRLAMLRERLETFDTEFGLKLSDADSLAKIKEVEVELRRLTTGENDIRIRTNAAAAIVEIEALRKAIGDVDKSAAKAGKEGEHSFQLMRVAIEQLGPPLVPILGGAGALASGFIGLGTAGITAIKGISAEYKAGTPLGQQYAGMFRTLKDDIAQTEKIAAHGVFDGIASSVSKVNAEMPAFNNSVAQSSHQLGDIASHLTGALIGGFNTFNPLIQKSESYIDGLATRFEGWATGPGGAHFAATLGEDFDHLIPALESIVSAASHLVSAFNPVGTSMLDNITRLTDVIDAIPVGVLKAGATAYIAWRTAVTVTTGINAATAALTKFAAAETAAATASTEAGVAGAAGAGGAVAARAGILGRTAGGLATMTARLVPYAAAWIGASIAIDTAANATAKWRKSTDETKAAVGSLLQFGKELLHFNIVGAFKGITGDAAATRDRIAGQRADQGTINRLGLGPAPALVTGGSFIGVKNPGASGPPSPLAQVNGHAVAVNNALIDSQRSKLASLRTTMDAGIATIRRLNIAQSELAASGQKGNTEWTQNALELDRVTASTSRVAAAYNATKDRVKSLTDEQKAAAKSYATIRAEVEKTAKAYAAANDNKLGAGLQNTFAQNPVLSAGVAGLQGYAKSVDAAVKSEQAWTKVTDDNTVKIGKNVYERKAWNAAVDAANGDTVKAAGLLEGHTRALAADQAEAQGAAVMQGRLSSAIGAAEDKYKINDQQLNIYAAALGVTTDQLATGEISQNAFVAAVGKVKGVVDGADTAVSGFVSALGQFESGADTAASRGQLLAATMVALNGTAISYGLAGANAAKANQKFVDEFNSAAKGVVHLKTGFIDFHRAGAQPLLQALSDLQGQASQFAAVTYQNEVHTKGLSQASKDAADVYYNDTRNALVDEHKQLGITRGEAEKLADRYFHWPKSAKTRLELMGTQGTNTLLNGIGEQLALLTHHPWIATLNADTVSAKGKAADLQARIDRIRQNKVPHLDADSAAARAQIADLQRQINNLQDKTIHINAVTVQSTTGRAAGRPSARGNIFKAYASGGVEGHYPEIASTRPGTVRIWNEPETEGEAYIPLANDSRRPAAKRITAETAHRLGGVALFEAGGFSGVTGKSGSGSGSSGGHSGSSGSSGHSGASASSLSAIGTALGRLVGSLSGPLAGTLKAENALVTAINKLPGSQSGLVKWLRTEDAALNREIAVRNKVNAELTKARAYYQSEVQLYNSAKSTTAGAVTGLFDISSAGNGPSGNDTPTFNTIYAEALQDRNRVTAFRKGLEKLLKGGLNKDYVMEIASKGPAALPEVEALAAATPAQLKSLNAVEVNVVGQSNVLGKEVADYMYGKGVAAAKALLYGVNPKNKAMTKEVRDLERQLFGVGKVSAHSIAIGLQSEDKALNAAAAHIAKTIEAKIKKDLGIKSPSKVGIDIGANTAGSVAIGLSSQTAKLEHASRQVGAAAIKHLGHTASKGGAGALSHDPRVDALIASMTKWFAHPPEFKADGKTLGRFVQKSFNELSRLK